MGGINRVNVRTSEEERGDDDDSRNSSSNSRIVVMAELETEQNVCIYVQRTREKSPRDTRMR
jgi:hypothetical protein